VESNDDIAKANHLPDAGCTSQFIEGGVAGGDVDFFQTYGDRCMDSSPTAEISCGGTGCPADLRLCMFTSCRWGTTGLLGCDAGVPTRLPMGIGGCCAVDGGSRVAIEVDCDGDYAPRATPGPLTSYVVVDRPAGSCQMYDVAYHY
jgi:hypothetical protein